MKHELNQKAFGQNAEDYAQSNVHAKGASLQRLVEWVRPGPDWTVLDVATGAGHTAFAFAPHVRHVQATDITQEMLDVTARDAAARGLENVSVGYAAAEELPFPDEHFSLVTCRIAPHHFPDIGAFVSEAVRVTKSGGILAVVDNIVPPGPAGAYVNAFEKLRDFSHGRCLSMEEWHEMFAAAGLELVASEVLKKAMSFSFWAKRHEPDMQAYLHAMLELASGEAARFLAPEFGEVDTVFHLYEGLFVAQKSLAGPQVERF